MLRRGERKRRVLLCGILSAGRRRIILKTKGKKKGRAKANGRQSQKLKEVKIPRKLQPSVSK